VDGAVIISAGHVAPEIHIVFERLVDRENGVWEITGTEPLHTQGRTRLAYARWTGEEWARVSQAEGDRYFGALRIRQAPGGHRRGGWMAR
jgi:hypothetical protein